MKQGMSLGRSVAATAALAAPMVGRGVLSISTLTVDTIMVGWLPDSSQALTVMGYAAVVVAGLYVVVEGLAVGISALTAKAAGARDEDAVGARASETIALSSIAWLIVLLAGGLGASTFVAWLGGQGGEPAHAAEYLRPRFIFALADFLLLGGFAWLRGTGDTRTPLLASLVATAANPVFSYPLMFGWGSTPGLGLAGAAYGTGIAQILGLLYVAFRLRRNRYRSYLLRPRPPKRRHGLALLAIGGPSVLNVLLVQAYGVGQIAMLARLDAIAVAATAVGRPVLMLGVVAGGGVARATMLTVSRQVGARSERAHQMRTAGLILAFASLSVVGLAVAASASHLPGIFGVPPNSPLARLATLRLWLVAPSLPLFAVAIVMQASLAALGRPRASLLLNLTGTATQLFASYALGYWLGWGAAGVWLGGPTGYLLRAAAAWQLHRRLTLTRIAAYPAKF